MKAVSEVHFRVIDHGLFLPVARRLAREAGKVSYWTPNDKAFPTVQDCIGDGFDDIERVQSPWDDKESVSCFVMPDIGFCHLQEELIAQGYPVWGARKGDILEISRGRFLQALEECGLKVAPHEKIEGITRLREFLKDKEDLFIKISRFRGDWETKHWRSWEEDETWLDEKSVRFGPFRDRIIFYCFERIDTEIEDGIDTWCVQGACPELVIHGLEHKDRAYVGAWQKYTDLPEELREVTDAFMPLLKKFGYQSFFSTEVRITKQGEFYFIDPTLRAGSPPSQIMTEMIGNYAEVIWGGANGELVEPEPAAKFGVQAVVELDGDPCQWTALSVDDELDRWLKASHCVMLDGRLHFAPDTTGHYLQWLTGIGDKLEEAIYHLRHNVSLLPEGTDCEFHGIADLLREVQEAEAQGISLTDDKIPKATIVMEEP